MRDNAQSTCPNCGSEDIPIWRLDGGRVSHFVNVIDLESGIASFKADCRECDWVGRYTLEYDVEHEGLSND